MAGGSSGALGINALGDVVGYSTTTVTGNIPPSPTDAVLWSQGGLPQNLGTLPGGTSSEATGINGSGVIVGDSTITTNPNSPTHAFLLNPGGVPQDLGTLEGHPDSFATAINASGVVVGYAADTSPSGGGLPVRAFMYEDGQMTDLNSLIPAGSNWILLSATAINDNGVIVGVGLLDGQQHAYKLFTGGPSTFVVNNTNDSGPGSLRQAILDSNNAIGATNTIDFDISSSGVQTIVPLTPLPAISNPVLIDGTSEPGYSGTPLIELSGSQAGGGDGLTITGAGVTVRGLDIGGFSQGAGIDLTGTGATGDWIKGNFLGTDPTGTKAAPNELGVQIDGGASGNLIGTNGDGIGDDQEQNVISGNLGTGIMITGANTNNNVVAGNWIGTDASGSVALGNGNYGVLITSGAQSNWIGVSSSDADPAAERNVIAANTADGVAISQSGTNDNVVAGNFIGTDASGTHPLGNIANGATVFDGAQWNRIGTDGTDVNSAYEGNVIAANGYNGIIISDPNTENNVVAGNFIGTDVTGKTALGNANAGILVRRGAAANLIGGEGPGVANVISGNSSDGIQVTDAGTSTNQVEGNLIGLASDGASKLGNGGNGVSIESSASGNSIGGTTTGAGNTIADNTLAGVVVLGDSTVQDSIRGNAIFDNGKLGIDLGGDGVTLNHGNTVASGPNDLENYPVVTAAGAGAETSVSLSFLSLPNGSYTIDFYASPQPDPSGYGQGQSYLGSVSVTTDANGLLNPPTTFILTADTVPGEWITATATDSAGNTSEFSLAFQLAAPVASKIAISSPALNLIAGSRGQMTVQLEDSNGNAATSSGAQTISLKTSSTAGAFYSTQVSTTPITSVVIPAGDSSASFYYSDTEAGAPTVQATDIALSSAPTQVETINPGAATNLVVKRPPGGIVAGIGFGLEVDAMDAYGNLATSFGGSVTVGLANGSGGTLTGTTTVNAVGGVANFTNLFSNKSGSVSLSASSDAGGTNLSSPPTGSIPVSPAPADHFVVTTTFANPDEAGTVGTLTVTAEDQFDNVAGSGTNQYEGTVDFDNTDVLATGVPTSYTFTAADAGSHAFNNVVLKTAGMQTITATDSVDNTITGATTVDVVPAAVNDFVVTTTFANPDVAGTVATVVVTAQDAYGNTDGSGPDQYVGTVELTSTDSQAAGLPASHVFTTVDSGSYTFAAVILKTAGAQTITATDSVNHTITEGVSVNVVPAAAQNLVVTTNFATSDVAGTAGTVTVTAEDAYNNRVSSGPNQYAGKVNLSDTDSLATGLPPSYTFTDGDAGSHTFASVVMKKAGTQSITATDSVNHTITGATTVEVVPAAVNDFVVTTTFANADVAGTVGTVVVTAVDAYGNTVGTGPNSYEGTVKLTGTDGQATGLPASHVFTASDAGSFTFVGVGLKTAGSQTITATDSVKTSVVGTSTFKVTAGPVSHLVLTTPPPDPIVAGQPFTLVVSAEDAYGNVVPTFNGSVTISLPGDTGLTTTVQANNGVARFTGLVVNTTAVQGESITATSSDIKSPPSSPVTVLPPPVPQAPTVISEQPVKIQLFNKKGEKTGKPVSGFALRFSTTMNSSTAGLPANYHVYSTFIKKVKKTTVTSHKTVNFTSSYNPATNTVTLEVKSTQPFAKAGGEITIAGITDQAGTPLDASDTTFIIGKNGKSVGPL